MFNLNNGGVSPQPRVVQEAVERYGRLSNEAPSYYMWRVLDQEREPLRSKLAELAINRNSSEALETIIFCLRFWSAIIWEPAYTNGSARPSVRGCCM